MSQDEEGRIGIFPSWRSLYVTVIVFGVAVIVLLTILTRALNFGAGS